MSKTATIKAQMDSNLKREVEAIFKTLGLSRAEAIRVFYRKVKKFKGLPFKDDTGTDTDTGVPKEETTWEVREREPGNKTVEWESVDPYFEIWFQANLFPDQFMKSGKW